MSIYAYLNCHDCRQTLWLGKALHVDGRPYCYHQGGEDDPPHWRRAVLNQAVWKFLAEHTGHRIDVRLEHEMTDDMWGYRDIYDNGLENYVTGWPGRVVGSERGRAEPGAAPDPAGM